MRSGYVLAAFVFLATSLGLGQAEADPWLILVTGGMGSINAHTTRQDLVRTYGEANVLDQDVDIGEGDLVSGTIVFPKDPERRIEILWKDPNTKTTPESADIRGTKSRWHAVHGIALGTSASELERLNGRPFRFTLTNEGTDMAAQRISWRGGALEKYFQGDGRLRLELEWAPSKEAMQRGPNDLKTNSDSLDWRAQNPHVSRLTWLFPSCTRP